MGHKMHGRRLHGGHRTVGSIYEVQPLGAVNDPHSPMGAIVPVLGGAIAAVATALGLRYGMTPVTPTQQKVVQYAPYIGLGVGELVALIFGYSTGKASGMSAAASALIVSGAMITADWGMRSKFPALSAAGQPTAPYLGAIVAEYGNMPGRPRALSGANMGEIVWQKQQNVRGGDVVQLRGITQSAYGTPGFQIHP